jgi:CheY-like chemotaxis protein
MNIQPLGLPTKKILVVDDNVIIVQTLSLKLKGAGYQVITAMEGSEAVAAARKEHPDLILMDLNFPPDLGPVPWDGFRLMEWLHRLDSAKTIPIIVITGCDDPDTRKRCTDSGAVAFFHKPIEHENLLKVIRATLGEIPQV